MSLDGFAFVGSADITSGQGCFERIRVHDLIIDGRGTLSQECTSDSKGQGIATQSYVIEEIENAFNTLTSLQLDSLTIKTTSDPTSGKINMTNGVISGLALPTTPTEATSKAYVDAAIAASETSAAVPPCIAAQNPAIDFVRENSSYLLDVCC